MTQMTATIIAVYIMTFFTVGISQRIISISPQLYHNGENQNLCPGEEVNITCEIRGQIIVWLSDEYIGPGQIEFVFANSVPSTRISSVNPNIVATLIHLSVNTTEYIMVSQLRIIAQSQFLNSYVNCTEVATGNSTTVRIQVLGM